MEPETANMLYLVLGIFEDIGGKTSMYVVGCGFRYSLSISQMTEFYLHSLICTCSCLS